jgi:hypothetical protein
MARKKFSVIDIFDKDEGKKVVKLENTRILKVKKSFSIRSDVFDDIEVLAWYMEKSISEGVEEALRLYLSSNKKLLEKAKEIRESKK